MLKFLGLTLFLLLQNFAHTWSSRSRNSGNAKWHFLAAIFSNGVWFVSQVYMFSLVWKPFMEGSHDQVILIGAWYILVTSLGSSLGMKVVMALEKGSRRVGARPNAKE